MTVWRGIAAGLAGLVLATSARAEPPLAAYGQLPGISNIEVSPDGTKWAAILGDETHSEIQIREFATSSLLTVSKTERAKVRALQWAGPDHLIATVSTTASAQGVIANRREWFMVQDFQVGARKWKRLLGDVGGAMNVIAGAPTALMLGGKPVLIVPGITFPGGTSASTLYRVSLDSGQTKLVDTGNSNTEDWVIGADGKPVARADYDQKTGEWRLYLRPENSWKRAYTEMAPLDSPSLMTLGSAGDSVLVSTRKSGTRLVHDVAVTDGAWSPPRPELDTDQLLTDPATHRLIGTFDRSLETIDYRFFSEADQKLWRALVRAFPGELVTLASWSDDRMQAIVEVEGPTNGDAFFVVDRKAKTANWLADRYPGIAADDIAPVRAFRYKAADGMAIPAYLTLPRGRAAKGLPLIVLAHGGPASRDNPGFDWWAQALASRGYAVLQPQFRGSAGFGVAHRDAGFGQWGARMQTDLSDGVRTLARDGTIDPARVCIAGGSYGGYAALAGVTLDPGVYRCASAVAGVSDLRRMLAAEASDAGSRQHASLRYWQRFMGAASVADPRLDAISPARLAVRVTVPVQLIHGKDDTVVRFDQSVIMEKALRSAGKPVELVTLPGEDHWLSRAPTRIAMLTAMVGFLEKHNPPDAKLATAQ